MSDKIYDLWIVGSLNVKPIQYYIDEKKCWVVVGGSKKSGYPITKIDSEIVFLKEYMYDNFTRGRKRKKERVFPTCNNKKCINPSHLKLED